MLRKWLIPPLLGLEIETLSPGKDHFLKGYFAAWKGGMDDPSGGLPPPRTPALAKDFFDFWLKKFQPLGSI